MKIAEEFNLNATPESSIEMPVLVLPSSNKNEKSEDEITLNVCPSTGGELQVAVDANGSIEEMKKKIARRIQRPQDRINLLFKDKVLDNGTVAEHNLQNGSKITLIPAMESGFSSTVQGANQSVVQAIEALSDAQINDFLDAHAPLTLALRVSDNVMFVQLQLEQTKANSSRVRNSSASTSGRKSYPCKQLQCPHTHSNSAGSSTPLRIDKPIKRSATCDNLQARKLLVTSPPPPSTHSAASSSTSREGCSSSSTETSCSNQQPSVSSQQAGRAFARNPSVDGKKSNPVACGRITSGIGSLNHHATSGSSLRFMRHIQRLGRLCAGHRQCVAYSSRELASEVSSIVQATKHSSECGSSRRSNGKSSSRDHDRASTSSASRRSARCLTVGASIDTITAHGPGIFSGTFTDALHPSVQDDEGRPKREPQTILQILSDLMNATTQYEGQPGGAAMLPQLFRDHFKDSLPTPAATSSPHDVSSSSTNQDTKSASSAPRESKKRSYPFSPDPAVQLLKRTSFLPSWMTSLTPHLRSVSSGYVRSHSSRGVLPPVATDLANLDRVHRRTSSHLRRQQASLNAWLSNFYDGREHKFQTDMNVSKQKANEENLTTFKKVQSLRRKMELKRKNREKRRQECNPCRSLSPPDLPIPGTSQSSRTDPPRRKTSVEIQIERKAEMQHDGAETVTA